MKRFNPFVRAASSSSGLGESTSGLRSTDLSPAAHGEKKKTAFRVHSENATDGFSSSQPSSDAFSDLLDSAEEIPHAVDGEADGTLIEELIVEDSVIEDVEDVLNPNFSASESEEETQVLIDSSAEEEPAPKRPKTLKVEGGAVTQEEKKRFAEIKLITALDGVYKQTDLPHRTSAADVEIKVEPVTDEVKGRAKCLLCPKWFKVQWSGYSYKVQNYKRHLTDTHVDTKDSTGKKEARKVQLQSKNKNISTFFQPKIQAPLGKAPVIITLEEEVVHTEGIVQTEETQGAKENVAGGN